MGEICSKGFCPLAKGINLAFNWVSLTCYAKQRQVPAFLKWKSGEREAGQLDHNPNFFAIFFISLIGSLFQDAFSGCQILPCSHKVHRECAIAMIQNGV